MEKIAIIGAGISGLSVAQMLKRYYDVTIFEKDSRPGGLIKCDRIKGSLFHTCGGHVFNSKRKDVLEWFWNIFQKEEEFSKTERNSVVFMGDGEKIPYPIENHIYLFDEKTQKAFYDDLSEIDMAMGVNAKFTDYNNFGEFLRWRFGKTLYNLYFRPYNEKVWRRDLTTVPMSWMEGKLPMPTTQEMRDNNANKVEERTFVHSTFWYEKRNGSQYLADRLAENLNILYNSDIQDVEYDGQQWIIQEQKFDKVVFCGNIKDLVMMLKGVDVETYKPSVKALEYHGTTAVFCEIDKNPYSWIYLPSRKHESHRIICTGNFAPSNNDKSIEANRITATIEFTDEMSKNEIMENLNLIPLHPKYLDHQYNQFTYPIQDRNTRTLVKNLKTTLASSNLYFTGRFADWEYYNMDVAIGAAMDLAKQL